jgi:hypothetical protein
LLTNNVARQSFGCESRASDVSARNLRIKENCREFHRSPGASDDHNPHFLQEGRIEGSYVARRIPGRDPEASEVNLSELPFFRIAYKSKTKHGGGKSTSSKTLKPVVLANPDHARRSPNFWP